MKYYLFNVRRSIQCTVFLYICMVENLVLSEWIFYLIIHSEKRAKFFVMMQIGVCFLLAFHQPLVRTDKTVWHVYEKISLTVSIYTQLKITSCSTLSSPLLYISKWFIWNWQCQCHRHYRIVKMALSATVSSLGRSTDWVLSYATPLVTKALTTFLLITFTWSLLEALCLPYIIKEYQSKSESGPQRL